MGSLFVIGTPIGNLEDITKRALSTIEKVDYVFCEDTRITKRLLTHYDIQKKCISYNSYSGILKVNKAISLLKEGFDIALVCDAGTPTIQDPGVVLVREVIKSLGEEVVKVIPGASSITAALSISGAPASSFVFLGFLPRKKGREKIFKEMSNEERTMVFFESPHRIIKTLETLKGYLSKEREVIVLRELTKIYEEIKVGNIDDVYNYYLENEVKQRGEFVVVISSLNLT